MIDREPPSAEVLERAWQRERARRKEAERLLEEKSRELYASYSQLEKAHEDLKQQQAILVQAEKMASLGVLAAGIAHEINNPVGFVASNLESLRCYLVQVVDAVADLRGLAEQIGPADPLVVQRDEVLAKQKTEDLDFALSDALDIVVECNTGILRVREIVAGLKTFARTEVDRLVPTDLHDVVESALTLLHNQTKHACDIVRDYAELPRVLANPGKLAQVFVNLLVNAVQAIEEKASGLGLCGEAAKGAWGTITVRTEVLADEVRVAIGDTGCGMPPEVRERIFQPFFTTKPVGQGTGLGLAISYGIVQEHAGRLEVESAVGSGTIFTLVLPVPHG